MAMAVGIFTAAQNRVGPIPSYGPSEDAEHRAGASSSEPPGSSGEEAAGSGWKRLQKKRSVNAAHRAAIQAVEDLSQRKTKTVIDPQSNGRVAWDLVLGFLIIYSVIIIPFRIGFDKNSKKLSAAFIADVFVDAVFFLDMALNFLTGFYNEHEVLVTDRRTIAVNYLKTWFVVDFVSTVPLDLIVEESLGLTAQVRFRSLKLVRVVRLSRLLKLARLKKLSKILGDLEEMMGLNPSLTRLIRLLFYIMFAAHMLACFWYFVANIQGKDVDTWIQVYGVEDEPLSTKYISAIYWATATMTGVGYGDVYAESMAERIYSIFTQMIGASLFGFLIGNISSLLESIDVRSSGYRRRMAELRDYMADRKLPKQLQGRIKRYYEYYLARTSVFNEEDILSGLSPHLRNRVLLQAKREAVTKIEFFADKDQHFVTAVVAKMKPLFLASGDHLIAQGDGLVEMYFLLKGTMELFVSSNVAKTEVLVGVYTDGSYFGDSSILFNKPAATSVLATTYCDLFSLARGELHILLARFTSTKDVMEAKAMDRDARLEAAVVSCLTHAEEAAAAGGGAAAGGRGSDGTESGVDEGTSGEGPELRDAAAGTYKGGVGYSDSLPRMKTIRRTKEPSIKAGQILVNGDGRVRPQDAVPAVNRETSARALALQGQMASYGRGPSAIFEFASRSRGGRSSSGPRDAPSVKAEEVLVESEETDMDLLRRGILSPYGQARTYWDLASAMLIVYSVIVIPYRIGFRKDSEVGDGWFVWDRLVDFFFTMDILLTFRTGYVDDDEVVVTVPALISHRYLRGWFAIDFMSTIPLDLIVTASSGRTGSGGLQMLRMLRMLRLIRLVKVLRLGKVMAFIEEELQINTAVMRIIKLLLQVSFVAHFLSCGWHFVSVTNMETNKCTVKAYALNLNRTEFEKLNSTEYDNLVTTEYEFYNPNKWNEVYDNCNWWLEDGLEDQSPAARYVASLYWSFTTMTTVGYGDINAGNDTERLYATFCMLVGVTVFGYMVGSMASLVEKLNQSEQRYKERLDEIKAYMKEQSLSKDLQKKVKKYFEQYLHRKSALDEGRILGSLSDRLRRDVLLHVNQDHVKKIAFFEGQDDNFVSHVVSVMRMQFYLPEDYIVSEGHRGNELFFLVRGRAEVVSAVSGQVFEMLNEGSHFGEIGLLVSSRRQTSVRALTHCSVFVLHKDDLDMMMTRYPVMGHKLRSLILTMQQPHAENRLSSRTGSQEGTLTSQMSGLSGIIDTPMASREGMTMQGVSGAEGAAGGAGGGGLPSPVKNNKGGVEIDALSVLQRPGPGPAGSGGEGDDGLEEEALTERTPSKGGRPHSPQASTAWGGGEDVGGGGAGGAGGAGGGDEGGAEGGAGAGAEPGPGGLPLLEPDDTASPSARPEAVAESFETSAWGGAPPRRYESRESGVWLREWVGPPGRKSQALTQVAVSGPGHWAESDWSYLLYDTDGDEDEGEGEGVPSGPPPPRGLDIVTGR